MDGADLLPRAFEAVPLAAIIKKAVSIPVITTGRLDPVLGDQFIREGKIDAIEMQRRLLADPDLPNKAISGHMEDVAPCTACLQCCSNVALEKDLACRVNAALGYAEDYHVKPGDKKKKVVVIGGGPGGMEAARVAALRGHQVTLFEKEPKLGGLLPLAALVKGTEIEDLPALVKYLETQITKLGVDIRLGKEFTPSMLNELKPDVVFVATGASATVPNIPGIENKIVVSGASLHHKLKTLLRHSSPESLRPLTKLWMPVGKRVVIIGGAIQGVELAEFLIKRGRKVTIVDTGKPESLGEGMAMAMLMSLMVWLGDKGIPMLTEVKYEEITDKGLVITTKEGQKKLIEADSIATATSMKPNNEILKDLQGKVPEIYTIGDCDKPGLIIDAIAQAYHIARKI
jgi:2,4-dienoyl-CoA reductase (NADPH2)